MIYSSNVIANLLLPTFLKVFIMSCSFVTKIALSPLEFKYSTPAINCISKKLFHLGFLFFLSDSDNLLISSLRTCNK